MLYRLSIEPNRTFLRALMSAFYDSSSKARELLTLTEETSKITDERVQDCFARAWEAARPLKHLPLTQKFLDDVDHRATTNIGAMHTDTKARFFAYLADFVRHVKQVADRESYGLQRSGSNLSAHFAFTLPVDDKKKDIMVQLKLDVKQNFATIIDQLKNEELRSIILREFTPAALETLAKIEAAEAAARKTPLPLNLDFHPTPTIPLPIPLQEGVFSAGEAKASSDPAMAVHLH